MPVPDNATTENPYGPLVNFQTQGVFPPSAVYLSPDDSVVLLVRNPTVAVTLHLSIRMLTPQGEVKATHQDFVNPASGALAVSFVLPPSEGFILSATVFAPAVSRGQCFVKLFLANGLITVDSTLGGLLCQGYVSDDDRLSYPQSPTESSLNGRGWVHGLTFNVTPGAAFWSVTVPPGVRWILRAVTSVFNVSALVGNRHAQLILTDPVSSLAMIMPQQGVLAAPAFTPVTWGDGLLFSTGNPWTAPLIRELILGPGWTIQGLIDGFQAGDTWALFVGLFVEEYVAE